MKFILAKHVPRIKIKLSSTAMLVKEDWDDWGKYQTQFLLIVFNGKGDKFEIGRVKIGQKNLKPGLKNASGHRTPSIPKEFEYLDGDFFSLGQEESYYENLYNLDAGLAEKVLGGLRDFAYNLNIFEDAKGEQVVEESLLRFVSEANVVGKMSRMANSDAHLSPFHFDYKFNTDDPNIPGPELEFRTWPGHQPPTNVHVLIGRNGVGKTRFLQSLATALIEPDASRGEIGNLTLYNDESDPWSFTGLLYISFSAFDAFQLPCPSDSKLKAAQVSLRGESAVADKTGEATKAGVSQFSSSLSNCRSGVRRKRWRDAINSLASDPLFEEAEIIELIDLPEKTWKKKSEDLFSRLSSGHAAVLLTITKLVELVDEYTIVLMDEPEGHLHPPLLPALIRSLSNLLTSRNGIAIIATHSPVVLQEVPKSSVWILRRTGYIAHAERPELETFGENVGTLTAEVFGLEVTSSGFHKLLQAAVVDKDGDYRAVVNHFRDQLGAEARAIVRSLAAQHKKQKAAD